MQLHSSLGLCFLLYSVVKAICMEADLVVNNYFYCLMQLSSWLISVLSQTGLVVEMSYCKVVTYSYIELYILMWFGDHGPSNLSYCH